MEYDNENINSGFYFLNHCFTTRYHPTRPTIKDKLPRGARKKLLCPDCREYKDRGQFRYFGKWTHQGRPERLCSSCLNKRLDKERNEQMTMELERSIELTKSFSGLLADCTKFGTCDILSAHHELLKDDPDRLSSEFLIGIVCGTEGIKKYRARV